MGCYFTGSVSLGRDRGVGIISGSNIYLQTFNPHKVFKILICLAKLC